MKKTTQLAALAVALTALLGIGAREARADVAISFGIPLPGVAFYAPPPPVYFGGPAYFPPAFYAPPAFYGYGPAYGRAFYGSRGGSRGGWGRHGRGWNGHGHRRGPGQRW